MMPLITGIVVDEAGAPVADASVFVALSPVSIPDVALLSAADGSFTLNAPADGHYRLGVRSPGNRSAEVDVTVDGDRPVNVRVKI